MPTDPLQPIILSRSPRRRRPRRKLRIGFWMWRVGICSLVLGLGSAAVVHGFQPYAMRHQQKRETAQLVQSLNDALEQNRTLKRQIESLRVGQGLEIAARKLGYVRKGEIPLQISIASTAK